jgi:hypothetical protein
MYWLDSYSMKQKRLSLRDAYILAVLFGTRGIGIPSKIKAGIKALLYKMGLDVSLQHPIWFRDGDDCPECLTDEEWSKSKFRFMTRLCGKYVEPDPTCIIPPYEINGVQQK